MASKGGKAKDTVLDIQKWIEQPVRVKFTGGREVTGTLQGFDALVNLVLDDVTEYLRDPADPYKLSGKTRHLGLIVCRGPSVSIISPVEGTEEIANPFGAPEDEAAI
jgi:U6 snRNA-associated Sm-like protein LSm7